jgi:bacterioferritin (cytochrome b1)
MMVAPTSCPSSRAPGSPAEIALLNFYRASELHGGLILGQMVRRTRDPELILNLTRHSAEELMHAQLWTETIIAIGGRPAPVRETYQTRYAEQMGTPITMLEILALTQVFERRVYRHFTLHLRQPDLHPVVAVTLRRMIEEEKDHLTWVKRWLDAQAVGRANEVRDVLHRYAIADERIYAAISAEYGWRLAA